MYVSSLFISTKLLNFAYCHFHTHIMPLHVLHFLWLSQIYIITSIISSFIPNRNASILSRYGIFLYIIKFEIKWICKYFMEQGKRKYKILLFIYMTNWLLTNTFISIYLTYLHIHFLMLVFIKTMCSKSFSFSSPSLPLSISLSSPFSPSSYSLSDIRRIGVILIGHQRRIVSSIQTLRLHMMHIQEKGFHVWKYYIKPVFCASAFLQRKIYPLQLILLILQTSLHSPQSPVQTMAAHLPFMLPPWISRSCYTGPLRIACKWNAGPLQIITT